MRTPGRLRVSIVIDSLHGGGVQAVALKLAQQLPSNDLDVRLVSMEGKGELLEQARGTTDLVTPNEDDSSVLRNLPFKIRAFAKYLQLFGLDRTNPSLKFLIKNIAAYQKMIWDFEPDVVISTTNHINICAVVTRLVTRARYKVVVSEHTNIEAWAKFKFGDGPKFQRIGECFRRAYKQADRIIVVSKGGKDALIDYLKTPSLKLVVLYNPAIPQNITERASEPVDHPWLNSKTTPVAVAIGRISKQKDYDTLIEAMRLTVEKRPIRLIVIGAASGEKHESMLVRLKEKCLADGLADSIDFIGYQMNPAAFLSKADLFVLSSRYEGFGLVIAEALACGCPVVSTDCQSGPAEILDYGKYGILTPVGDPKAMSSAILEALGRSWSQEDLKNRANDFSESKSIQSYRRLIREVAA